MRGLIIIILFSLLIVSSQAEMKNEVFPDELIKNTPVIELSPIEFYTFETFRDKDLLDQKTYSGLWSTLNQVNLDKLTISYAISSSLGTSYKSANICDGKTETAWVEGAKGNGVGEWIKIQLDAEKRSPSSTPFSVFEVGIIPGYSKSEKTWRENNRIKTLTMIVFSPPPSYPKEYEYMVFRLKLQDKNKLQYFELPDRKKAINLNPMTKTVWLRIEDVYKGTKYDDTCISEVILVGGCLP